MSDPVVKLRGTYELPVLALNAKQAAAALGVSWDTWQEHIEPEIKTVRLSRRRLVPVAELQRWLAEHAELDGVDR